MRTIIRFFVICLIFAAPLEGVTLVYNLRVRRIFSAPALLEQLTRARTVFSVVPIYFSRKSHLVDERTALDTREKRDAGGALLNLRYVPSRYWWLEATTGLETDHASFQGTDSFRASRAGLDDLVLTGGGRYFFGTKSQMVAYGLLGIPTRKKITRCDRYSPLVGTRVYSLGFGAEASYTFLNTHKRSLSAIAQYRLIHGFNRNWFPILPEGSRIQPGDVNDILITMQYREKRTLFEVGYNATIFAHQAIILPTEKIDTKTFVRHGGYASLSHGWLDGFFGKPFICGAGFNINHTNKFDARTATVWIYGTVVF